MPFEISQPERLAAMYPNVPQDTIVRILESSGHDIHKCLEMLDDLQYSAQPSQVSRVNALSPASSLGSSMRRSPSQTVSPSNSLLFGSSKSPVRGFPMSPASPSQSIPISPQSQSAPGEMVRRPSVTRQTSPNPQRTMSPSVRDMLTPVQTFPTATPGPGRGHGGRELLSPTNMRGGNSPMRRQGSTLPGNPPSSQGFPRGMSPGRPDRNPSPSSPGQFPPATTIQASSTTGRFPSPRYASPSVAEFPGPNQEAPSRRFNFAEQQQRPRPRTGSPSSRPRAASPPHPEPPSPALAELSAGSRSTTSPNVRPNSHMRSRSPGDRDTLSHRSSEPPSPSPASTPHYTFPDTGPPPQTVTTASPPVQAATTTHAPPIQSVNAHPSPSTLSTTLAQPTRTISSTPPPERRFSKTPPGRPPDGLLSVAENSDFPRSHSATLPLPDEGNHTAVARDNQSIRPANAISTTQAPNEDHTLASQPTRPISSMATSSTAPRAKPAMPPASVATALPINPAATLLPAPPPSTAPLNAATSTATSPSTGSPLLARRLTASKPGTLPIRPMAAASSTSIAQAKQPAAARAISGRSNTPTPGPGPRRGDVSSRSPKASSAASSAVTATAGRTGGKGEKTPMRSTLATMLAKKNEKPQNSPRRTSLGGTPSRSAARDHSQDPPHRDMGGRRGSSPLAQLTPRSGASTEPVPRRPTRQPPPEAPTSRQPSVDMSANGVTHHSPSNVSSPSTSLTAPSPPNISVTPGQPEEPTRRRSVFFERATAIMENMKKREQAEEYVAVETNLASLGGTEGFTPLGRPLREAGIKQGARTLDIRLSGLQLKQHEMKDDGNCLFRAVAHQIWDDPEKHVLVRESCVRQLRQARSNYAIYFDNDAEYDEFVDNMSKDAFWGDEIALKAIVDTLGCVVYVVVSTEGTWYHRYAPGQYSDQQISEAQNIFLSYLSPIHYNSLTYENGERISLPPQDVLDLPNLSTDARRMPSRMLNPS